jgi:hypothetical protein
VPHEEKSESDGWESFGAEDELRFRTAWGCAHATGRTISESAALAAQVSLTDKNATATLPTKAGLGQTHLSSDRLFPVSSAFLQWLLLPFVHQVCPATRYGPYGTTIQQTDSQTACETLTAETTGQLKTKTQMDEAIGGKVSNCCTRRTHSA